MLSPCLSELLAEQVLPGGVNVGAGYNETEV